MVNPEICSGHLNFRDRDSHFIFGDVATAVIVERGDEANGGWDILGTRLKTQFSNNIRNNSGFLNRAWPEGRDLPDKLFVQQGRKVFKEVVPMVSEMILDHAAELGLDPRKLKRLWLHQANINMNEMIGRRVLGRDPTREENVIILDEYANTSSAGSIIAFHKHSDDMAAGDIGLICSFGAGYRPARCSCASAEHPRPPAPPIQVKLMLTISLAAYLLWRRRCKPQLSRGRIMRPRIDDGDAQIIEIGDVARGEREAVLLRCGGDQRIGQM